MGSRYESARRLLLGRDGASHLRRILVGLPNTQNVRMYSTFVPHEAPKSSPPPPRCHSCLPTTDPTDEQGGI